MNLYQLIEVIVVMVLMLIANSRIWKVYRENKHRMTESLRKLEKQITIVLLIQVWSLQSLKNLRPRKDSMTQDLESN